MSVHRSLAAYARAIDAKRGALVGLDHGRARVGLAVAVEGGHVALPWLVVPSTPAVIATHLTARGVRGVVVGLPKLMSGVEGKQCAIVRSFVGQLDRTLGQTVPIVLLDERLSSTHAARLVAEAKPTARSRKRPPPAADNHDAHAAAVILQSALDQLRLINAESTPANA